MNEWIPIALGLGSNLGDRRANLTQAIRRLREEALTAVTISDWIESEPVDCGPCAPMYLNMAMVARTRLSPDALLTACQKIERSMGRPSLYRYHADRLIDIDLLLYGQARLSMARLVVPHPVLHCRDFVLRPLSEIAPDWRIPGQGRTVSECWRQIQRQQIGGEV